MLLSTSLMAACRGAQPVALQTPVPIRTAALSVAPTTDGWVRYEQEGFALRLPDDWQIGKLEADAGEWGPANPELAGILKGADAQNDILLWAFARQPKDGFTANLSIRRSLVGPGWGPRIDDARLAPIAAQLGRMGFAVSAADCCLTINGLPAARIAYRFSMQQAGRTQELSAQQHLFLSGSDLWILTYTADLSQEASLAAIAERSASSLEITSGGRE